MTKKATHPAKPAASEVRHPIKAATLLYSAPKFILRGPIYMMFVSMFAMLTYSTIATTDTLVSAPLTLQRETVTVQAIGGGLVESLDVKENEPVIVGQALATVQEKIRAASTPEQEAINRQIREDEDRLNKLRSDFRYQREQKEKEIDDLKRRQGTDVDSLHKRIEQLKIQQQTAEQRLKATREDQATAEASLARLRPLCAARDIPATQCESASQRVTDLRRAAGNVEADIANARLSLESAANDLKKLTDPAVLERMASDLEQMIKNNADEEKRIQDHIDSSNKKLRQAQTLVQGVHYGESDADRDKAYYTVPDTLRGDGVVTTVHVQKGQLVNPGSPLFTIVKNNAPLIARVLVQNKDIGLLKIGQDVKIKYFAYPFQEYGIQSGSIEKISVRPSSAPGESSLFEAIVALASERVWHQPQRPGDPGKSLEIGLTAMAEIKTGDKRFIELLFTPASKFFKAESGGEGSAAPAESSSARTP